MSNNEIRELFGVNKYRETYYPTEKEILDYINNAKTNFVFLFGRSKAGKTAVLCGLHQAANGQNAEIGKFEVNKTHYKSEYDNPTNAREYFAAKEYGASQLSEKMLDNFKDGTGFLLERTTSGSFYPIKGTFTPKIGENYKPLDVTFLHFAGEDLENIKKDGGAGQCPAHIEMFFRAVDLSICYILTTPWYDASKEDELIANFINYSIQKNKTSNKKVKYILLLTCWDTYNDVMTVEEFVKENMLKTFDCLSRYENNVVSNFSLGAIDYLERIRGESHLPFLKKFNPSYSIKLWNEINKSFLVLI